MMMKNAATATATAIALAGALAACGGGGAAAPSASAGAAWASAPVAAGAAPSAPAAPLAADPMANWGNPNATPWYSFAPSSDPDPRHCGQSVAIHGEGDDPAAIQALLRIPTSRWSPGMGIALVVYEAPPASMSIDQYKADAEMVADVLVKPDDPAFALAAEEVSFETGAPVVDRGLVAAAVDDKLPVCLGPM